MFTFVRMGLTGETTMDAISTPPKTVKVLTPTSFLLLPRIVDIHDRLYCVHHVHLHACSLVCGLATFMVLLTVVCFVAGRVDIECWAEGRGFGRC